MSSSDARLFADLVARVAALEELTGRLAVRLSEIAERVDGKDMHGELYGEPVNHTAEREALAETRRPPGRPRGS